MISREPAVDAPVRSQPEEEHDVVAIGCGPFNLGLAALALGIEGLDLVVFEAQPELRWHPGLMFEDATLQLSFLADLVTLVDPTHPLSFLAYLRDSDRMYGFYVRERFHPTRREYEDYLRWVAGRLPSVRFSQRVERVERDAERARFVVELAAADGSRSRVLARDLVIGIGSEPHLPKALRALPESRLLHSACYLERCADVARASHVTVIGSGQSAAEIVVDLLRRNLAGGPAISWLTRSRAFAPLDYTKLVLEMTTPAYVEYFHGLPQSTKDRLLEEQWQHYKGISSETLDEIHDLLYRRELQPGLAPVELRCGVELESAEQQAADTLLCCRHRDTRLPLVQRTGLVVAATGYRPRRPAFLDPLEGLLRRDRQGRPRVRLDYSLELTSSISGRIFQTNGELHSHGAATPDLGIGAVRNATILNTLAGREIYRLPQRTAFTSFAPPAQARAADAAGVSAPCPEAAAHQPVSARLP